MIEVQKIDANTFEVTVQGRSTTKHQVSLNDDDFAKLTAESNDSKESLIVKSFEFLLQRESNTMILSQFDLMVIQEYFPEYMNTIRSS